MSQHISRRQVARFVALELGQNRQHALALASAWLVQRGNARQSLYLVRDIARELQSQGYVYAQVTSAHKLASGPHLQLIRQRITAMTNARELELDTRVDGRIIGGLVIQTPSGTLDGSVQTKLRNLANGRTT